MTGAGPVPRPVSGGGVSASDGRTLVVVATALLLVIAAAVTALVMRDRDDATSAAPAPAWMSSDGATSSPSPGTPTSPTAEPTQQGPTAADALDPFFDAAVSLDRQLQTAAAAINTAGPAWEEITDEVADTVRAADLAPAADAIPAGLPDDLRQAVVLVFSDLASRRKAMESFAHPQPILPDETEAAHATTAQLVEELGYGHEAATRFDDDVAAARALAVATPAVAPGAPDSRLTAEVRILVEYVRLANAGCDARGGGVVEDLPTVTWRPVPDIPEAEGTVDVLVPTGDGSETDVVSIAFNADPEPDGTWNVYFFVG